LIEESQRTADALYSPDLQNHLQIKDISRQIEIDMGSQRWYIRELIIEIIV